MFSIASTIGCVGGALGAREDWPELLALGREGGGGVGWIWLDWAELIAICRWNASSSLRKG